MKPYIVRPSSPIYVPSPLELRRARRLALAKHNVTTVLSLLAIAVAIAWGWFS